MVCHDDVFCIAWPLYAAYQIQNVKKDDSFNLSRANLWDSFSQNHIPGVKLDCYELYQEIV